MGWAIRISGALQMDLQTRAESNQSIARHKTAIRRKGLSLPVRQALNDGVIDSLASVFDFGCGHGEDIELLGCQGIKCCGWDPAFRPDGPHVSADVVNLGYVVNVIEDVAERQSTLRQAWGLCRRALIVSAQILVPGRGNQQVEFGDGVLTRRGTFQKFFTQGELREYIETALDTEAIPAALGIFYAFRDETLRQQFLANRYRHRSTAPRQRLSEIQFEEHKGILEPLMRVIEVLGRLPEADEFDFTHEVLQTFGSLKRAFSLIRRVTGEETWKTIGTERRDDLLVYLALSRFRRRPRFTDLPICLQRDIRAFFGAFTKACEEADGILFQAGNAEAIDLACQESKIGKLLPNALYVHRSALESLAPLLRVYEGCGRAYLGELPETNVIKIHRFSGKISYLAYPAFETDPHPALTRSYKLAMRTQYLDFYDYASAGNPPVLHRKETFLEPTHPLYSRFARLTRQEEKHGLLDDSRLIGTKDGWEARLRETGFAVRGHRIMRADRGTGKRTENEASTDLHG